MFPGQHCRLYVQTGPELGAAAAGVTDVHRRQDK